MKNIRVSVYAILFILLTWSCQARESKRGPVEKPVITASQQARLDTAYFASGCFWCTEAVYERVQGVIDVVSGYSGGTRKNPTYQQVSAGRTDHAESVRVAYDPETVTYRELVEIFYASHDPTQLNRQGPDVGKQYRSAIWYRTEAERDIAREVKEELNRSGKYNDPIVTELTKFSSFWEAEEYHQDYYEHHPENPYVQSVSRPKVEKFMKEFKEKLKPQYK
ncbi:MAG: peptide-methionine (S)-S-oxide reductase MsrA [Cyclobacteriaceae bacterium]